MAHLKESSSFTTSVFTKGSCGFITRSVHDGWTSSLPSPPPKPLFIVSPTEKGTYPVALFLPGYEILNTAYEELLGHICSHGFVLVAPQLYLLDPLTSGQEEIDNAAKVVAWLDNGYLEPLLPDGVVPDFTKFALTGHSRGGKGAFALALGLSEPALALQASVLIGIDPVAGTSPHVLDPTSTFDISIPVAVVGTGLGPEGLIPCAPKNHNHVEFYAESKAPRAHFVAKDYGHMDMLDDGILKHVCEGSEPRESMRRATGGITVAFMRAYLNGDCSDLEAIVGDRCLSPATLDPVEYDPE